MKEEKNKKKNEINIKTIWKFLRSEKGKRYSFFIFYIFFFIFVFSIASLGNNKIVKEPEQSLPFKTLVIENNNYSFQYTIKTNYNEIPYKGIKDKNDIVVYGDEGEYHYNYLNGKLINANDNNKILHEELFDIYEIKKIIKSSKLISETKLNEDNKYVYNYKITNDKLNQLFNNNVDDNLENEITIKTNSKKELEEIEFNLLNYEKKNNTELNECLITIIYEVNNE